MEAVARSIAAAPSLDDVARAPDIVDTLSEHEVSAMLESLRTLVRDQARELAARREASTC